jgi:hypothetical protein
MTPHAKPMSRPNKPKPILLWDAHAEMDLLRHCCRENFWTFFLCAFGAHANPKGKRWIDPEVHMPLADWFQGHVREWTKWREHGIVRQKHLCVIVHREIGKTTLITRAGQLWLHLLDPEIATATGSEKVELASKMLEAMKAVLDGTDEYSLWTKFYGDWATSARKWTGREVVHAGRRNTARQDPSLISFGVETSITGSHPDAIFYDDPISYERLKTDTNWLEMVNSQVSSLVPVIQSDGLTVWVGTRYDDMDHFGAAFKDLGVCSVSGMESSGIPVDPKEGMIDVYFLSGRDRSNTTNYPEGEPTTPKVWPHDRMKRYQRTDPLRYAAQVMNDPSISEMNPITREQIEQCKIDRKEVPWSALRFAICCDTAFSDGNKIAGKDETVMLVHGYPRNGSGDVYVIEGHGNTSMRAEDFGRMLVTTVQRYRKLGFKITAITDEKTRAGKKGVWELTLRNFFHDANEPMPRFIEFERGSTKKFERLHTASTFWVDGHVRVLKGSPGIERLCEQMARIGQYAVNPRIKIDWADAHSDAFQPDLYQPMRRAVPQTPFDRGSTPIPMEGMDPRDYDDDEMRHWNEVVPREPIR